MNAAQYRRRGRALPIVILGVLLCSAILTSVVVRGVVHDQEERLLRERTNEAATVVSSLLGRSETTLGLLALLARPTEEPDRFENAARLLSSFQGGAMTAAVADEGGGFSVIAAAGNGPDTGEILDPARADLAQRAAGVRGAVSTVVDTGDDRRLIFALAAGAMPATVLFQEMPLQASEDIDIDIFSELSGVLYASPEPDPDQVVFATTSDLPLDGEDIEERAIEVGADEWLIVTTAKRPLVGGLAHKMPWIILAGGLLTALLVSALVEVLSRRRAYAMKIADERTVELRDALAEREHLEQRAREAQEASDAANRSKSEFLSRMSHELRTPLNAVLGFAQLLELDDLDEPQRESVDQILKAGRHLLDLINEVLDISRIETGNFALSPEPVLVSELLADVIDLIRPLAADTNVQLVTQPATGCDVHVLSDRQRIKQVLLNLVVNAVKYNRAGGTVSLSCEAVDPGHLRIKVTDTGPGISPDQIDHLFTPFERLGAEHTNVEGTGIGLALSLRLTEAMGGMLDFVTEPGRGSTFWVELPVVEGPVERHERLNGDARLTPSNGNGARRTILYVEDNLSNLRLVERVLDGDDDVELISSMQGRLGLELAREHQPDLVLLDLHLPDTGGEEILRQLRDDPRTSSIPVVIVSADATPRQVHRLKNAGATAYLTKPLDVRELAKILDELVQERA